MGIILSADFHIGHRTVSEIRGFATVADHDDTIMHNIFKRVNDGDTFFLIGDLAMGGWETNIVKFSEINCTKHVILGNHDRPAPNNSNGHAHLAKFIELGKFNSVSTMARIGHNGRRYMLSHYPYNGDHTSEARYDEYRLRDHGHVLFHGHTHSDKVISFSDAGTTQIHVGLDAWNLFPVSIHDAVQAAVLV